jgi:hypothetical protein
VKALSHPDGGDDMPAKVNETPNLFRGQRHVGHLLMLEHLLNLKDIDAERVLPGSEGHELLWWLMAYFRHIAARSSL